MLRAENVATPLTAATAPPPLSVPPPGLVPIVRVTLPVKVVAVCPAASCAVTLVTLNSGLFTAVRPVEVARRRYPFPALLIDRSENVATPATATTGLVPESVPLPGFAPAGIATLMLPVNCVAVLPNASRAVTSTGGVITAPAGVLAGATVNASCVAAPGTPSAVKVTGVPVIPEPVAVAVRVFVPGVWFRVQLPTVAIPLALVV